VIQAIGSKSLELGKLLTLNAKALVVRQMPVKYIELHRRHSVQIALEHIEGNEVAAYIDHQSSPWKTWFVLDGNCRHGKAVGSDLNQLKKCLQPAHDAERVRRAELRAGIADFELVGFVLTQFFDVFPSGSAQNHQSGVGRIGWFHVQRKHAGSAAKVAKKPIDRALKPHVGVASNRDREGWINQQLPGSHLHLSWHRHKAKGALNLRNRRPHEY